MSWTSNGVNLPAEDSPSKVFQQLFVNGTPSEVQRQLRELKRGRSILDTLNGETKKLNRELGQRDQDELKIEELAIIEKADFGEIARLLGLLKAAQKGDHTLLDQTIVMVGSNHGNANAHSTRDLPILVAGGGFKHGQHIIAGGSGNDNTRFANLFVQIAHRLDVGLDRFGSSTAKSVKGFGFI